MKALLDITPSPEQLALFSRIRPGVEIIRGAAGSGKTTTALLKLRAAVGFYINRRRRQSNRGDVRVLVLTYNRTLRGYINELATKQLPSGGGVELEVSTFSGWAQAILGNIDVLDAKDSTEMLQSLASRTAIDPVFAAEEAMYLMGRFLPGQLNEYLTARRDGRGAVPRMERPQREILMAEVVSKYIARKHELETYDWNDLAVALNARQYRQYDVVVVDETQDLSANELRAVMRQLADEHTVTFVLDTTQRIYARSGFTWQEVGIAIRSDNSHRLSTNYRNTKETAQFAAAMLDGIETDVDGTMPDFESAVEEGDLPLVVRGRFSRQLQYAIDYVKQIDLTKDSVAFLHVKGGGWFSDIREALSAERLGFVTISRRSEWPAGEENIALSTIHSAKGLEFDYVILIGLNGEVEPDGAGEEAEDEITTRLRRLVAMGVGRARKGVLIGYKPSDEPVVAGFFRAGTYRSIDL